jgi:malate dehydrogenase (oxaloacetate-decarboxylating)(NADP+)
MIGICAVRFRIDLEVRMHGRGSQVSEDDLFEGRIYPPLARIREVSLAIAVAVAKVAYDQGLARVPKPDDLRSHIKAQMFDPSYKSYM